MKVVQFLLKFWSVKKVILMTGAPGSGKSFLAKQLQKEHNGFILSTDDYWYRPDGYYDFNIKRIGNAHQWNQSRFKQVINNTYCIIVDNTNLEWKEIKPYVEYAIINGYEVSVAESEAPWRYDAEELFKRNTHNVPLETIKNMLARKKTKGYLEEQIQMFIKGYGK